MFNFEDSLHLESERLCLEFANTMNWHASEHPVEELPAYADLTAWAQKVGLLSEAETQRLKRQAGRRAQEAEVVLERARTLREAIYRLLAAVAADEAADPVDLALINAEVPAAFSRLQMSPSATGFVLGWPAEPDALDRMLWPVAVSAVDLLTQPDLLTRVGQCADDRGCGYLFLDMTKNHSRRWCDMRDCGNRAKARRHYERQKAQE